MNFWLNINSTEEPMNNANYISNKEFQITDEDLDLIRDVLRVLASDILDR